jgi:hypothetical protein
VVQVRPGNVATTLAPKAQFLSEGWENFIQKIVSFQLQGKTYLALARRSGLVQLYEDVEASRASALPSPPAGARISRGGRQYKLYKDWKHANINSSDAIVLLGFLDNRFLYSCSHEGKLVFRDLINDDADESYLVYLVQSPVRCFAILATKTAGDSFSMACADEGGAVKVYKVTMDHALRGHVTTNGTLNSDVQSDEDRLDGDPVVDSDEDEAVLLTYHLGLSIAEYSRLNRQHLYHNRLPTDPTALPFQAFTSRPYSYHHPHYSNAIRRRITSFNLQAISSHLMMVHHNERKVRALVPIWVSRLGKEYQPSVVQKALNWFISLTFVPSNPEVIICGTQFGELLVFNITRLRLPMKRSTFSQFGINKIEVFDDHNCQYIAYTDTMAKVGIINLHSMEEVNWYDGITMGPISASLFVYAPESTSRAHNRRKLHKLSASSTFEPLIFITSSISKKLLVYKLFNNNTKTLVAETTIGSLVQDISLSLREFCDDSSLRNERIYTFFTCKAQQDDNVEFASGVKCAAKKRPGSGEASVDRKDSPMDGGVSTSKKVSRTTYGPLGDDYSHDATSDTDLTEYLVKIHSPLRFELNDHSKNP